MRVSEDIKKLGEDIISSYKLRIKAVGEIVSETHNMLTDFQKEHKTMSDELRKNLEKIEKGRLQESHNLMSGITKEQVERNKYVTSLLKKYDNEQKIIVNDLKVMADELKKSLGKGETDRLEEFDKMIADVQNKQDDRNKYVVDLLLKFADEQKVIVNDLKVMADELKKSLGKSETDRLEEFDKMIADVQNKQTDRSEYVADLLKKYVPELLKKFADEQKVITDELKVMTDELKKSLIIGETDRLEVFDEMMDDVHAKQADRSEYVADLLNKFVPELLKKFAAEQKIIADDHLAMTENWKEFNKTMSNLKSGKPIVEKKVKVRTVKEAIEEEKPEPEPKPEKPVEKPKPESKPEKPVERPKPEPKPAKKEQPWEKDIPIEDKVLAFINAHPKGVKVGDMEEPLDVIRMRLGVIAKKLLDAGKVKKVDKEYFPI